MKKIITQKAAEMMAEAGLRPDANWIETRFWAGDRAIVMRLTRRVDPTASADPEDWEFSWVEFHG